jgi:GNAT superfamily N-acetyltransferase/predicted nucleic acid-binding protein
MKGLKPSFEIISGHKEVKSLLGDIIAAADRERKSFGFMPHPAYHTVSLEGRLIVARQRDSGKLLGYIIVGGTFPQARIFQTYVDSDVRGSGVGKALVEEVVRRSEASAFLSIRAEVAEDLIEANRFYRNLGFRTVRRRKGGATTGRTIISRVRELTTPSLLDLATYGDIHGPALPLSLATRTKPPLYLIDLNVLFDVTKRRGRALAAGRIFAAALDNSINLAVSEEFIEELERAATPGMPDPTLELSRVLPRLRKPTREFLEELVIELAPVFFPTRASDRLTPQDRSDLAHVATALHEGAKGFVTSEKVILAAAQTLRERYDFDVISPVTLGKHYTAGVQQSEGYRVRIEDRPISCSSVVTSDEVEIAALLKRQEVPEHVLRQAVAPGNSVSPRRRVVVRAPDNIIAFASWDTPKPAEIDRKLYLFADSHDSAAELAIDHLLNTAIADTAGEIPSVLRVTPSPDDTTVRQSAIRFGFRPRIGKSARTGRLEKICLNAVVTDENWARVRSTIEESVGLSLPAAAPLFDTPHEGIRIVYEGGRHAVTSIGALEDLLSPAIFAVGDRVGAIIPITPDHTEALFRGSRQPSFLEGPQASLLNERRYFGGRQIYRTIPEEGVLVFYESRGNLGHGRSAAIAVARIRRRYLADEAAARGLSQQKGVLSPEAIRAMAQRNEICVIEFDNLKLLKRDIPLSRLKEIDCADNANLVTARRLRAEALGSLLKMGMSDG